jgi:hypothetical protein
MATTARQHLVKMHEAIASHHRTMSKCHSEAMTKEAMSLDDKKFHKAAAAAHDEAAQAHDAMCEECSKASDADDLSKRGDQIVPTRVSAVAPERPRITPVLRTGQREIAAGFSGEPELSKIFGLSEEDQNAEELSLQKRK